MLVLRVVRRRWAFAKTRGSEFVKKRPGTPGLALASFFSSRASLRTSDVANGRRENGNC
jgi:hypothetical protein